MEREDIFQEDASNRNPLALDQDTLLDDQFRVGRVLGVGGFGITYLAFDEVLEMVVAVKEYLPNDIAVRKTDGDTIQPLSSGDGAQDFEYGLERFLQEARTLAKFERHPNIVRVRTFFQENGTGYLVMNFYEGRTLAEYLDVQNGFIPEDEALLIVDQILDGLGAVHEEGILHRDIDPNNVYLADDGTVVLLDFGAARTAVGERTQSMSVVLKRGYAPHEQYHSYGDQGPWTDVYACSATLYRALTGYKPPEAAARILDDDLAPPNALVPSLSDAANEAIIEGLAIRPDDRPQSVGAFAELLPSPEDAEPHWIGEETTIETGARPAEGAAELRVTATRACRLYVDGSRAAELESDETYTLGVDGGTHRLRAVRTDRDSGGSATVTASESDIEPGPQDAGRMSLDSLVWQDVITVSDDDPTGVDIDFDANAGSETESNVTASVDEPPASERPGAEEATAIADGETVSSAESDSDTASPAMGDGEPTDGTLRVDVPQRAAVYIDDEQRGTSTPNDPAQLELPQGVHAIRVEAVDDSGVWEDEVTVESEASETLNVAFGGSESASDSQASARVATGLKVGLGAGVLCIVLVAGWVWLGSSAPGPNPRQMGEAVLPEGDVTLGAGRSLWSKGRALATSGAASVRDATTRALVWADLLNRRPRPQRDSVVATKATVVDVTRNDRDPEGDTLRVVSAGPVPDSVAQVTLVDSGRVRVQLAAGTTGSINVPYAVTDGHDNRASSSITVRVPFSDSQRLVAEAVEQPQVVQSDSLGDDSNLDILIAGLGTRAVSWSENTENGHGGFTAPRPIETELNGAVDVHTADLNGNGRRDVIAASLKDDAVVWYENRGGGDFGDAQFITAEADGAVSVRADDFDGDGDADVLVGALLEETVTWFENQGEGTFGDGRVVAEGVKGLETIHLTDLDGDDVTDVLVVSYQDSTISRYEPVGDTQDAVHFEKRPPIGTRLRQPIEVHTADLLGNGRVDVLAGKAGTESLVLFENRATDGTEPTFGNKRVLTTGLETVEAIESGDIEGDGTQDVFAASFDSGEIIWLKNRGDGTFGPAQPIATDVRNVISIEVADVDQDGDLDVLSASQANNAVALHENRLR